MPCPSGEHTSTYPPGMRTRKSDADLPVIELVPDQEVNLAGGTRSMVGLSSTASLAALDLLFKQVWRRPKLALSPSL